MAPTLSQLVEEDGTGYFKEKPRCPCCDDDYTITLDDETKVIAVTCSHEDHGGTGVQDGSQSSSGGGGSGSELASNSGSGSDSGDGGIKEVAIYTGQPKIEFKTVEELVDIKGIGGADEVVIDGQQTFEIHYFEY